MLIRRRDILDRFVAEHADAQIALQRWVDTVEEADWLSHTDIKLMFPSADYIGNGRYVFNIKGNRYRLVVVVIFVSALLTIRYAGTHAQYDKINSRTI